MGRDQPAAKLWALVCGIILGAPASAYEVYSWVDENGVTHFSQWAPAEPVADVKEMVLPDAAPPNYDPAEDRYAVEATSEQVQAVWDELEKRREERREREANSVQPVVRYQEYESGYGWPGWSLYPYPRPDNRPDYRPDHRPDHRPGPKPLPPLQPMPTIDEPLLSRKPRR